jgi:hypothetical protein
MDASTCFPSRASTRFSPFKALGNRSDASADICPIGLLVGQPSCHAGDDDIEVQFADQGERLEIGCSVAYAEDSRNGVVTLTRCEG